MTCAFGRLSFPQLGRAFETLIALKQHLGETPLGCCFEVITKPDRKNTSPRPRRRRQPGASSSCCVIH